MSRRDTSHETVRLSLERDGWTITHDPYPIRLGDLPMGIDLDEADPERSLYLAVPTETWKSFFARPAIRQVCVRYGVKVLVFSVDAEIVSWIE